MRRAASPGGLTPRNPHHQLRLSDEVIVDEGSRLGAGDLRPAPTERDLEAQAVAGGDLTAELRVVRRP